MRARGRPLSLPDPLAAALPVWAATRLGVLIAGYIAVVMFGFPRGAPTWIVSGVPALNLMERWDAGWYVTIATRGYVWPPVRAGAQSAIAFFPLYPLLMAIGGRVFGGHTLLAAWLISLAAFLWALAYLYRLARLHVGVDEAAASLVFLAAYPFALFYGAVYTESIFLLCLVGSVFHMWRGEPVKAGIWGALAGLARPNGFLLSPVLGVIAITPFLRGWLPRTARLWLGSCPPDLAAGQSLTGADHGLRLSLLVAALAPVAGMLAYSAYIYSLTGHAFAWAEAHAAWGRAVRRGAVLETVRVVYGLGVERWIDKPIDALNEMAALFALITIWPVLRRFGLAYALLIAVNLLPPLFAGGVTSLGRFTSVLFPIFLWLGAAVPVRHRSAWTAAFAMGQAITAILFFTWTPLY